jgi:hypothetical protein
MCIDEYVYIYMNINIDVCQNVQGIEERLFHSLFQLFAFISLLHLVPKTYEKKIEEKVRILRCK